MRKEIKGVPPVEECGAALSGLADQQRLRELIERLERAEGPDLELDALILATVAAPPGALVSKSQFNGAWCIYAGTGRSGQPHLWQAREWWRQDGWPLTESIDAAMSLAERVLGECYPWVGRNRYRPGPPPVGRAWTAELSGAALADTIEVTANTGPLALCIAILKAVLTNQPAEAGDAAQVGRAGSREDENPDQAGKEGG